MFNEWMIADHWALHISSGTTRLRLTGTKIGTESVPVSKDPMRTLY